MLGATGKRAGLIQHAFLGMAAMVNSPRLPSRIYCRDP
jgi:hypothetical protein